MQTYWGKQAGQKTGMMDPSSKFENIEMWDPRRGSFLEMQDLQGWSPDDRRAAISGPLSYIQFCGEHQAETQATKTCQALTKNWNFLALWN